MQAFAKTSKIRRNLFRLFFSLVFKAVLYLNRKNKKNGKNCKTNNIKSAKNVKNQLVDVVFLCVLALFVVVGAFKGGLKTALSFFALAGSVVVALLLSSQMAERLWSFCGIGNSIKSGVETILNKNVPGVFLNSSQILQVLNGVDVLKPFANFFKNKIEDIYFEGEMSFGEVFAPSISLFVVKVFAFFTVFLTSFLILKIVIQILTKSFCRNGLLNFGDRVLGCVIGAAKALILLFICYYALLQISVATMNMSLARFLQDSVITKSVFEFFMVTLFGKAI